MFNGQAVAQALPAIGAESRRSRISRIEAAHDLLQLGNASWIAQQALKYYVGCSVFFFHYTLSLCRPWRERGTDVGGLTRREGDRTGG